MKRTSLIIALLVLVPAASQARHSQRYRIRYHPYAFNYHNSGLIPGGIKYSPYALKPGSSGLVYEGTRYSPYAFNYHNSGLVVDYYWWQAPICPPCEIRSSCGGSPNPSVVCATSSRAMARRAPARRHAISSEKLREIRATDGMQVVRRYLRDRGLGDVEINHRLSVKNRTASVAFILREQGLIIKYSNPEIVESLEAEPQSKGKALERYQQRWEAFAKTFQDKGGAVFCVDTADQNQIVAALDSCDALSPSGEAPRRTTLYAKD